MPAGAGDYYELYFPLWVPVGGGFTLHNWSCYGFSWGGTPPGYDFNVATRNVVLALGLSADNQGVNQVGEVQLSIVSSGIMPIRQGTSWSSGVYIWQLGQGIGRMNFVPELQAPGGFGAYWNIRCEVNIINESSTVGSNFYWGIRAIYEPTV